MGSNKKSRATGLCSMSRPLQAIDGECELPPSFLEEFRLQNQQFCLSYPTHKASDLIDEYQIVSAVSRCASGVGQNLTIVKFCRDGAT